MTASGIKVIKNSLATFDLLKIVTSHPSQTYCDGQHCDRDSRWNWLGAINEPCFEKPTSPGPRRISASGSTIASAELRARPVRERNEISGRQDRPARAGLQGRNARCRSAPISAKRLASLVCGSFPTRTLTRPPRRKLGPGALLHRFEYYTDPKLVRPYRVGMSCGFCHVGPSPTHPPADPSHPE